MLDKSLIKRCLFLITVPLFLACPHRQRPPLSPLHPALNLQTPEPKTQVALKVDENQTLRQRLKANKLPKPKAIRESEDGSGTDVLLICDTSVTVV